MKITSGVALLDLGNDFFEAIIGSSDAKTNRVYALHRRGIHLDDLLLTTLWAGFLCGFVATCYGVEIVPLMLTGIALVFVQRHNDTLCRQDDQGGWRKPTGSGSLCPLSKPLLFDVIVTAVSGNRLIADLAMIGHCLRQFGQAI